jgi:Cupin domain
MIWRTLCRHWWASAGSPLYLRSRSAKRSAAAFRAGVHVEPHSHANEQIAWMVKGKMEFRLGSEQRVCGPGDVVVIPGGAEHEAWFREDTEVIDFFAPPRDDFLLGGKHAYTSAARCLCNQLGDRKPICRYRHSQSSRCPAVQVTFFAPFVRPTFPELRGAVRQHAFGWPALFPVRYLWCREPRYCDGGSAWAP